MPRPDSHHIRGRGVKPLLQRGADCADSYLGERYYKDRGRGPLTIIGCLRRLSGMAHSKKAHKYVYFRFVACCLGLLGLLLASGCGSEDLKSTYNEEDEPAFQRARQLLRQGRKEEALKDFQRLIQHRSEAPESHLEAANLYLKDFNDPLLAYYHYHCYLDLRPKSNNTGLVRGQLDVAKREFIRTMPGNLMGKELDKVELIEQVRFLTNENDRLKRQLQALNVESAREPRSAPVQTERTIPPPSIPTVDRTVPGTYEVAQGDTLSSISRRLYGHPGNWKKIYEANRDQLPTENSLKPGQVLKIPAE